MSLASAITDIEYPESDGRPMGETDLHRYWMNRLYDLLARRYSGQEAYVGCDLLVYFEEGSPLKYCVPDVFVALGARPGQRRTFKVWAEGRPPTVVFEVTSQSTRREDEVFKPQMYERMGVQEYFLYDPTADYLSPPLAGYRLQDNNAGPLKPDARGALQSVELGLRFWLEDGQLVVADSASGERLLTAAEAAEARAAAAEEEARCLREEIARLKQPPQS
jgi:Uma2 family endonuclease